MQISVVIALLPCFALLCVVSGRATGRVTLPSSKGKGKGKNLSFPFLVKSFFSSLADPTYGGLNVGQSSAVSLGNKGVKGKKNKLGGAGVYGEGGAAFASSSFGPVCGPGGCK